MVKDQKTISFNINISNVMNLKIKITTLISNIKYLWGLETLSPTYLGTFHAKIACVSMYHVSGNDFATILR